MSGCARARRERETEWHGETCAAILCSQTAQPKQCLGPKMGTERRLGCAHGVFVTRGICGESAVAIVQGAWQRAGRFGEMSGCAGRAASAKLNGMAGLARPFCVPRRSGQSVVHGGGNIGQERELIKIVLFAVLPGINNHQHGAERRTGPPTKRWKMKRVSHDIRTNTHKHTRAHTHTHARTHTLFWQLRADQKAAAVKAG